MLLKSLKFVLLLNCMVHEETAICNDRVSIDTSCMMNFGAVNGERQQQKGSKNPAVIHSEFCSIWELRWILVVTHPSGQPVRICTDAMHRCHGCPTVKKIVFVVELFGQKLTRGQPKHPYSNICWLQPMIIVRFQGTTSFLDEVDDCLRNNQSKMAADLFRGSISNSPDSVVLT
eukprot:scpid93060/ scgid5332/ 